MRINKMTEYALRIVKAIHLEAPSIVTSIMIAEKENLSQGIIIKILRTLCDHNIVVSHRGRGGVSGGYSMLRSLNEVTILEIVEMMEGEIALDNCMGDLHYANEMKRVNAIIKKEMSRYSILELIQKHY